MTQSFKSRLISAIVGGALIIFLLIVKGYFVIIPASILAIIGVFEFHKVFEKVQVKPMYLTGILLSLGVILAYLLYQPAYFSYLIAGGILCFYSILAYHVFSEHHILDVVVSIFSILYVVVPFILIMELAKRDDYFIWLVFILAFSTDTFGYVFGKKFGKRKLTDVSPKKTVEGALGGVLGCILSVGVFKLLVMPELTWIAVFLLASTGSVASIIGDLTASKIKRFTGVKDFGKLIPGHGGVLDRFDSILFTAPVIYIFTWFLTLN
ncbi:MULTISPECIES: phosphatidate cytidylyltransferase [unclassified Fusibacter]|uniref:phosphatidate cytidylyltransferase n=1 Tax=unclassified Fusibacter TaxID=2624464 RepID=UPI001012F0CF|nr:MULTISPECIES: phosphatidate cytidylyltransferase [unclassified Fusibacter]MCK8058794.1 phosphatidate cytidylyltransferase [Fusibacter sp. A2]NPE21868.1 phosphatidate cytidylyltransferase [Fusibacter sp. A1]RXV61440.1 phosphatidate cytidylyltransferase [Fusibacter sp. A1]